MEPVLKNFLSNLSLIVLVFLGTWLLGAVLQPIIIALIIALLLIFWKAPILWAGIKYLWNELWNKIKGK